MSECAATGAREAGGSDVLKNKIGGSASEASRGEPRLEKGVIRSQKIGIIYIDIYKKDTTLFQDNRFFC